MLIRLIAAILLLVWSGCGPTTIKSGDTVWVDFKLERSDGVRLDESNHPVLNKNIKQQVKLVVGNKEVLPQWDAALQGMRPAQTKRILIAPANGFGSWGVPLEISPEDPLILTFTVIRVE